MSAYTFSLVHVGLEQIFQHYAPLHIDFGEFYLAYWNVHLHSH